MSINNIHLRKIIKILFSDAAAQRSALRGDIREEIAKAAGEGNAGGDFYAPFWFDAKSHVFGTADLRQCVEERIGASPGRANLYPLLRDGFLLWWNERRRWTNEPFQAGQPLKCSFAFPGIEDATVKIDNILSVQDGGGDERFIYPYFSPVPALSDESARLSLWLLSLALETTPIEQVRVLDVIRGSTFSVDRHPLHGNEEENFRRRYQSLIVQRNMLLSEYA